jgi:hypothetical protein
VAPQHPACGAPDTLMPSLSSTRAAAAFVFGDSDGCTQPSSISTRRACRGAGRAFGAIARFGILRLIASGRNGLTARPVFSSASKTAG